MNANEKPDPRIYGRAQSKAPQPLVAQPLRETESPVDPESFRGLLVSVSSYFPYLKKSLAQSQMRYTPAGFVRMALLSAIYLTAALLVISFMLLRENESALLILALAAPAFYFISFIYTMQLPKVKAITRAKRIEQELVFAGRHMLIELQSGVPLFDAMLGISRDYDEVSLEFNKIVEKVTLGVSMGSAMHEVADANPSKYFNRLLMQMANSLASGSDVAAALESSLQQISREQVIELKAYGQKLNPIVMFFMIFGVIIPSLGVAFAIILVSFLGGTGMAFGPMALFGTLVAVGLLQFIFLSMIENSRPRFDIV